MTYFKEQRMANKRQKRPHLGRGLESLLGPGAGAVKPDLSTAEEDFIPGFPPDKEIVDSSRSLPVDQIRPNPYQPRKTWNEDELSDLTESIRSKGLIQPILVRRKEDCFEVIAGERRLRAAKLAGLVTIPSIVREADESEMLELALIENIHRADLNPIERAMAYKNYIKTFSLSQTEAAKKLGEDRSVVANFLRILDLPNEIKQMLIDRHITMGHARAILALPTDHIRRKLANRALAGRLSVREVESLVRKHLKGPDDAHTVKERPAHIVDLENKLRESLGTRVSINTRKSGKRGKIVIEFYSLDEFDRLTRKMGISTEDAD